MRVLASLFLICFTSLSVFAQTFASDDPMYKPLVEAGGAALEAMKYDSCMIYYKQAFEIKQTSYLSTLRNAACAYSANDAKYQDEQLKIAFDLNWGESKNIFDNYPEFKYLKDTPFDNQINTMYQDYAKAAGVDLALMSEFDNIIYEDQRYRKEMRSVGKKYGNRSPQMDSLWRLQNIADSINTIRICEVINEKGYPGKSIVGSAHASTAFLVIQHADLEVQEKYLAIISNAADEGEVSWSSVALLIDRVNMRNDKPQIYGSQVNINPDTEAHYFAKIEQPYKVDSIRGTVGLGSLQTYADNWDFEWDAEKHIQLHKELDAKKAMEEEEEK